MGTLLVSDVISRAQDVANDVNVRWTTAELIRWVNDGLREITIAQPEATAKTANIATVAGVKQSLPAGAVSLIRINRNMGVSGTATAEAPRKVLMSLMDNHRPTWNTDTATLVVKNYMHDAHNPRVYYVWPPMSGATYLEAVYAAITTPVTVVGDTIPVDDFYMNPLVDYVLYRVFQKDAEIASMGQRAAMHRAAFEGSLGLTAKGEAQDQTPARPQAQAQAAAA